LVERPRFLALFLMCSYWRSSLLDQDCCGMFSLRVRGTARTTRALEGMLRGREAGDMQKRGNDPRWRSTGWQASGTRSQP
jgi:hypothetical protein